MAPMDNRFLCPRSKGDPDALAYIAAVQQADGEPLEQAVKAAIEAFVVGCKADSAGYAGDPTRTVWDALQAACIMCGARTISGALVPLVGPAPTAYPQPVNFVSADYDRATGLKGDGATKFLDSNRAGDADGQDDSHMSVYATQVSTGNKAYGGVQTANTKLLYTGDGLAFLARMNGGAYTTINGGNVAGLLGGSRSDSANQTARANGASLQSAVASISPVAENITVFSRGAALYTDARLAFYSIGSALDLAALDARVTTLVSEIAAAIP